MYQSSTLETLETLETMEIMETMETMETIETIETTETVETVETVESVETVETVENPHNRYVRQLTAQEVAEIDSDGIDITDNQAKIFALAFGFDILFLDTTQSTAYLVECTGAARYLDQAQCIRVLRGRKDDILNPLNVLKYTPGHYEGVRWPRAGELQQP